MYDNLQSRVDELAEFLGRAVVVDDSELNIVYMSRHYGDEDEQRIRSLLQRDTGSSAADHMLAQGVSSWSTAGMVPANASLGMAARLCAPIRHRGELHGFLLVIDADQSLTVQQIAAITQVSSELAADLYVSRPDSSEFHGAREVWVRGLLLGDEAERRDSMAALHDTQWIRRSERLRATVIAASSPLIERPTRVRAALRAVVHESTIGRIGTVLSDDRACVISPGRTRTGEVDNAWAQSQLDSLRAMVGDDQTFVIGIGGWAADLESVGGSFHQASIAANAAMMVPGLAPVAAWERIGSHALTSLLPSVAATPELVPAPVAALLNPDEPQWLIPTLTAYLENAGSAPRTAAALHIHRTSLYYRLERIRSITGLDLDDGDNRLLLHLGVRMIEQFHMLGGSGVAHRASNRLAPPRLNPMSRAQPRCEPPLMSRVAPVR